jgi:hypothetical protein
MIVAIVALIAATAGTSVAAIKIGELSKGAKTKTVGIGPLTYVSTTTPVAAPMDMETLFPVAAACPAELKPVGGGIKIEGPDLGVDVRDSHLTATGWAGMVESDTAVSQSVTTTVACAKSRKVTGSPPAS